MEKPKLSSPLAIAVQDAIDRGTGLIIAKDDGSVKYLTHEQVLDAVRLARARVDAEVLRHAIKKEA